MWHIMYPHAYNDVLHVCIAYSISQNKNNHTRPGRSGVCGVFTAVCCQTVILINNNITTTIYFGSEFYNSIAAEKKAIWFTLRRAYATVARFYNVVNTYRTRSYIIPKCILYIYTYNTIHSWVVRTQWISQKTHKTKNTISRFGKKK